MPIYEYLCQDCGSKFEYLLRNSQEKVSCPKCNRQSLKKLISTFAFNSKDSSGNVTASSSGCASCSSLNCSSCSG